MAQTNPQSKSSFAPQLSVLQRGRFLNCLIYLSDAKLLASHVITYYYVSSVAQILTVSKSMVSAMGAPAPQKRSFYQPLTDQITM